MCSTRNVRWIQEVRSGYVRSAQVRWQCVLSCSPGDHEWEGAGTCVFVLFLHIMVLLYYSSTVIRRCYSTTITTTIATLPNTLFTLPDTLPDYHTPISYFHAPLSHFHHTAPLPTALQHSQMHYHTLLTHFYTSHHTSTPESTTTTLLSNRCSLLCNLTHYSLPLPRENRHLPPHSNNMSQF